MGGRVIALSRHLLFLFPNHEHLWPFKAEVFGFLVITSPNTCSIMCVIPFGFLLDQWYIFYIKMDSSIYLSQSNVFLNTGCMGMSSLLVVCQPEVSMALFQCHLGVLGIALAAVFVESRTPSSDLLLEIWGIGGCVQLQINVCTGRAINFRLSRREIVQFGLGFCPDLRNCLLIVKKALTDS